MSKKNYNTSLRNEVSANVSVTFRHTAPTSALKSYAEHKVRHCLSKYIISSAEVHVILMVEKRDHIAEVIVQSKRFDLSGKATEENLYAAIDLVVDRLDAQMRKQKEKLVNHHRAPAIQAVA